MPAGRDRGHAVLRRGRRRVRGLPRHRSAGDVRARVAAAGGRARHGCAPLPRAAQGVLQEVSVRAVPGGVAPGPLPARPPVRGDRDAGGGEQAGRGGLPHVDVLLPAPEPEPQLLQPDGRDAPAPLGRSLRAGGDDAGGFGGEQVRRGGGRHGRLAAQPRHDRRLLLHHVHHHRALRRVPDGENEAQGAAGDCRRRDGV